MGIRRVQEVRVARQARTTRRLCRGFALGLLGLLLASGCKELEKATRSAEPCTQKADPCIEPPSKARLLSLLEGCEANVCDACATLAGCYERGSGVQVDSLAAQAFASRACSLGGRAQCAVWGADFEGTRKARWDGAPNPTRELRPLPECPDIVVPQAITASPVDSSAYLIEYLVACARGDRRSCAFAASHSWCKLADARQEKGFAGVTCDHERAARLFADLCQAGDTAACAARARILNTPEAMKTACDRGVYSACALIGSPLSVVPPAGPRSAVWLHEPPCPSGSRFRWVRADCTGAGCTASDWPETPEDLSEVALACANTSYCPAARGHGGACERLMAAVITAGQPPSGPCAVGLARRACARDPASWTCLIVKEPPS